MDIINFIEQNFKAVLYGSCVITSGALLIGSLKNRKKIIEKRQSLLRKSIITHEQVLEKLRASLTVKDDNSYLLKAYPHLKNGPIIIQKDISYNQLYLMEPSISKVAAQVIHKMNTFSSLGEDKKNQTTKGFQIEKHLKWSIGPDSKIDPGAISIKGYGQIVDDEIFKVRCQFKKDYNMGLVKNLLGGFAYYTEFLLFYPSVLTPKMKQVSEDINRKPFIMGPIIGTVRYFMQFVSNRPLLIEARFEEGQLIPVTLASSKQNIVSSITDKIYLFNFKIIQYLIAFYVSYQFLQRHSKKFVKQLKSLWKKLLGHRLLGLSGHNTFRMLQSSKVSDNLICIICYTNCRNTILFNCRHMIMCDECRSAFKDQYCPLCKGQISEEKVLSKE